VDSRVLIVDDDPDWREFLRVSLGALGYGIVEAADGEQALSTLRNQDFDVILLDLHMPGTSGEEVAAQMPEGSGQVVFMTSASMSDVSPALGQGAHYYLPKGASFDQLALLLRSLHL
jgi:two-component system, chemotaxis family, chemotaxis protein CheY